MASLTPGILSKLLQNVDSKVTGQHRSALLQVIGIVPSLAGGDDNPLESRGYFLRVSDSKHSAYVSVLHEDLELVLSGKIQLGQFIHVTRLDSGNPLPVLRGVKPVPGRPPRVVGDPMDLISGDSLTRVDFSSPPQRKKVDGKLKPTAKMSVVSEEKKDRRLSLGNGKVEDLELRRLSLGSARRGWDRSPETRNAGRSGSASWIKTKETSSCSDSASVVSSKKATSGKDLKLTHSSLIISPLQNKNAIDTQEVISQPAKKDLKSSFDGTIPSHLIKLPLNFKTWSDSNVVWDSLPTAMHDLGKDVLSYRNATFLSAVHALEESSATECIIRCMSMFAELCESAQKDSSGFLVGQFLNLYENMQKAAAVIDAVVRRSQAKSNTYYGSECLLPEMGKNFFNKNATSWIQAALETDLSRFCLFTKEGNILNGEKCHYVILENTPRKVETNNSPKTKQTPKKCCARMPDAKIKGLMSHSGKHISSLKKTNIEKVNWSKGSGLKEAASLAEKLLIFARVWFLNYLENSFNNGFGLKKGEGNPEVAALLGQLKRVDQWLNDSRNDESRVEERIEGVRKMLYGFLLDHVDSTITPTS